MASGGERPLYHERQSLEMCALHAINNFLQCAAFTKASLDEICNVLAPTAKVLNPHRSWIGLGNYDVNVLIVAFAQFDLVPVWFDKRRNPAECLALENVVGFILNVPSRPSLGFLTLPFVVRRHWIAVKPIDGIFYNLDSKLAQPAPIGGVTDVLEYLRATLALVDGGDRQLFVVVKREVESERTWLREHFRPT